MNKLFILIFISSLIFSSVTSYAQQTETMDPNAATHYNAAIQFMKAEQYEEALKSIDSSLIYAKDYRIYYIQGQANAKLGNVDQAINSYNESLKLKPDYDAAWMAAGNTSLAAKKYDEAIADFRKAAEITKDPKVKADAEESVKFTQQNQSIEYFSQGNELNKQSKLEEAIAMYDKALSIKKDPKYYFQKGIVLSKLNKNKEAEKEFSSAIALDDSFDVAYIALGGQQAVNKDYENAIKNYEKGMSVTSNDNLKESIKETIAKTYMSAGNSFYKDKKYDQALQWFQKSIDGTHSDEAFLGAAKASIEKKKYNDAVSYLDSAKANQKIVTEGALAYYRGVVHLNKNEDAKALEQFTIAVNEAPYKKASQAQIDYLKAKMKAQKK